MLRRIHPTALVVFSVIVAFCQCIKTPANKHYPVNPSPLLQTRFVRLPLGIVRPSGWLRDQLVIQSQGLTGHLDEFWPDLMESAWKGGEGEAWERGPYYLNGLVPLAYILDDDRLIKKAEPFIEYMLNSGRGDGWFGPPANEDRWPLAVAMKVLTQYYEATRDTRVLRLLERYFQYLKDNPPDWPDDAWRGVRAMENAVTGYWLYRRTGNPDILEVTQSIFNNSFDWPSFFITFPWDTKALEERRIPYNWKSDGLTAHVVNVAMAVKYPGLWYQQARDERFKEAVYRGIENLDTHHGQVGGRFSGDEHLSGRRPTQGTEFCAVVEYMFSVEKLMEIFGDPALGDRLELLAYNSLPGTMTPDGWAHQYDQQANQVLVTDAERAWSSNGNTSNLYGLMPNYPCCLANMHQAWPLFVEHMWMATHDQGLAAVAYGPCVVSARVANGMEVTIVQETDYPFDGTIRMTLELSGPARFPLYFRIPGWAEDARLIANGDTVEAKPGTFAVVQRRWESGDKIHITFPMKVRTETRYNNAVSVLRGPLYYSLRIGKSYKRVRLKSDRITSIDYMGSADWEIRPTTPWNYGLVIDPEDPDDVIVQKHTIPKFPFIDNGERVYTLEKDRFIPWKGDASVVLRMKGRRIPGWRMKDHSADDPPQSPIPSDEREKVIELVPYGCARLRITEFPVIER